MLGGGVSHLGGSTLKAVRPCTFISSLIAWILDKVSLNVGKSSNNFSSIEAVADLLGDSDLSDDGILEEETKSWYEETI